MSLKRSEFTSTAGKPAGIVRLRPRSRPRSATFGAMSMTMSRSSTNIFGIRRSGFRSSSIEAL